jgi:UDP-N-acetylmuramoylalanine--D-glutamate ligase
MGRSGLGAARLLRARGLEVTLLESRDDEVLQQQAAALGREGITVRLGVPLCDDACLTAEDQPPEGIVVSPGIRWDHPVLEDLRRRGVSVQGEMVPAWEATRGIPWIGITGTNGKTTVTHLVHHVLAAAGLDAPLCGNVGFSAAELALDRMAAGADPPDWLVVELSSYQIEAAPQIAPAVGVWTTLTPDHLERHGTLANYRAIKRHLLEHSKVRILNADDPDLRAHAPSWDRADWVSAGPATALPAGLEPFVWIEGGMVRDRRGELFPADCLAMPGDHNRQNLVMATAVALHVGMEPAVMEQGFRSFPGVPHRLERIREHGGVTYFNDSKATNYDAAEVALRAMRGPAVVLAGGRSKRGDAEAWLAELDRSAAAVVLFGEAREPFAALLAGSGYGGRVRMVPGLAEAVPLAADLAAATGSPNVLLSPACASFDQYPDFEARGDHFRRLVLDL